MSIKKNIMGYILSAILFWFTTSCNKPNKITSINDSVDVQVVDSKIKWQNHLLFPDTLHNNVIDKGVSLFCFVPPDNIFYFDMYKKQICVVSSDNGKERFSFSRSGRGPGEVKDVDWIKFIPNNSIMVLDNQLRRLTIFDKRGIVKTIVHTPFNLSDMCSLGMDKLIVSSYELIPDYKPLHIISRENEKILSDLGSIVEPQEKLMERLNLNSFTKRNRSLFSNMGMVLISLLPDQKDLIYSQKHPYHLIKYNLETHNSLRIDVDLPYSANMMDEIIMDEKKESTKWKPNLSARVLAPKILNNHIIVPIFSADSQDNYLDCYALTGKFIKRLRIPPLGKGIRAWIADISNSYEIFVLVSSPNHFYWIEKFKID